MERRMERRIKSIEGPGCVQERGKHTYRLSLSVKYTNGETGRLYKTVKTRNKTEAGQELREWRHGLLQDPTAIRDERVTIDKMLDLYLEFCKTNKKLALRSLEGYRKISDRYLRPAFGRRFVDDISPEEIEDYFTELREKGGEDGKPLSGNTCKRIKSVLSPMFKRAIFLQHASTNPCEPITMPSIEQEEVSVLSTDQIDTMLTLLLGLQDQRLATLIHLALFSGCRRGELCGFRWCDIDFKRSTVHVRHSLAEVSKKDSPDGKTLHLTCTKTHETRNLSIDPQTMAVLKEHKTRQFYLLANNGIKQDSETYVFANMHGEPYRPSVATKNFEVFSYKYSFNIRLHDLRHTHASVLIMEGMPTVAVSKRLGHRKVSTTLDIYSHLMPGQDDALAAKMGEMFNRKPLEEVEAPKGKILEFPVPNLCHSTKTRVQNEKADPETRNLPALRKVVGEDH